MRLAFMRGREKGSSRMLENEQIYIILFAMGQLTWVYTGNLKSFLKICRPVCRKYFTRIQRNIEKKKTFSR